MYYFEGFVTFFLFAVVPILALIGVLLRKNK